MRFEKKIEIKNSKNYVDTLKIIQYDIENFKNEML